MAIAEVGNGRFINVFKGRGEEINRGELIWQHY